MDMLSNPVKLTKLDIARLRGADTVSFHHMDGASFIRATKNATATVADPFARELMFDVACGWDFHNYGDYSRDACGNVSKEPRPDGGSTGRLTFKAFEMIHGACRNGIWQTMAREMREGDELVLSWERGGMSSPALAEVGLAGDRLLLCISPAKGKGSTFIVDVAVRPANDSVGRMIII